MPCRHATRAPPPMLTKRANRAGEPWRGSAVPRAVLRPPLGVLADSLHGIPRLLEHAGGLRLLRVLRSTRQLGPPVGAAPAALLRRHGAVVLPAAGVVGVATGPGVAHLQELASHVRTHQVARCEVLVELRPERSRALASDVRGAEAPQRQQLVLVGLDAQHALLAPADAVEVGPVAQVERLEVESGIRVRGHDPILTRCVAGGTVVGSGYRVAMSFEVRPATAERFADVAT